MIRKIRTGGDYTILSNEDTNGLGDVKFYHPIGTFSLTPASKILIQAITQNQELLHGTGIDWGCGIGCLAIIAARIEAVKKVYGLEIAQANIDAAQINSKENGLSKKVSFMLSDSYTPYSIQNQSELGAMKGKVNFIVANPPSSTGDDGFAFRRMVLNGAKDYLCNGSIVLLNISFQYGKQRIEALSEDSKEFSYHGIAATTEYVPFDLSRPDLMECLKIYAQEEQNGGFEYSFGKEGSDTYINAQTALRKYHETGCSPLTKWQTHIFRYNKQLVD